jgi:hypothetical protein
LNLLAELLGSVHLWNFSANGGIMQIMKRFLLALLITLTAFRGLVGDMMATEMSAMKTAPVSVQAEPAMQATSAMPCHSAEEDESTGALPGCKTCQVCHLSAFVVPSVVAVAQELGSKAPEVVRESFASAEPLHFAKPPIL